MSEFDEKFIQKENNIRSVEAVEQNSENPVVDFKSYETICNYHNNGVRRRGILSEDSYEDIINDSETDFINLDNFRIPALMNVKHGLAMGYDMFKCEDYAKDLSSNVKLLTLPICELDDEEKSQLANLFIDKTALYFSDHNNDESNTLDHILNQANIKHTEKFLVDPRAAKGDEQASLFFYSCLAEQRLDRGEPRKLSLNDVYNHYEKNVGPFYTPDGKTMTILNMGNRINDRQAEEMWLVYDNKFDFLGKGHPISMQDSKEGFFELLKSSNTLVAATYTKEEYDYNKLVCFTYFNDDIKSLFWLNQDFLDKQFASSGMPDYVTNIFTPGLVSTGTGRSYSHLPIGLFSGIGDEAGMSANVMYENTNLSKKYVPRIVDSTMAKSCANTELTPSKIIDKVTYRLWSIGGEVE
jgi:hypothetical protein